MTRVCLGILARNEEGRIGQLIADLGQQTLLANRDLRIDLHVVANACTDGTVAAAEEALRSPPFRQPHVQTAVHHLAEPGKSNAWNTFIHTLAPADTEFVFLLDADIRIPETASLQLVLDRLVASEGAVVAVDRSVKDLSLEAPRTFAEWLIRAGTGTANDTRTAIAGALYCARFPELRKIWMPLGLPGEDGFLRAMILTDSFSRPEDLGRLVYVEGARHLFESERSARGVFRHNVRLAIGTGINALLFEHLRDLAGRGVDLAAYIRERNEADPRWLNALVRDRIGHGRYFVMNRSFLMRRLRRFRALPPSGRLTKGPILLVGGLFDALIYMKANSLMRKGQGAGYW